MGMRYKYVLRDKYVCNENREEINLCRNRKYKKSCNLCDECVSAATGRGYHRVDVCGKRIERISPSHAPKSQSEMNMTSMFCNMCIEHITQLQLMAIRQRVSTQVDSHVIASPHHSSLLRCDAKARSVILFVCFSTQFMLCHDCRTVCIVRVA